MGGVVTAFPSLPLVYGMKRFLRVDVRERRRMDLKVERIFRNRHVQHIFEIPWRLLSSSERSTLDSFFQSVRGRILGDIDFVDPWDSVHYTCRLDTDELGLEEEQTNRWTSTLRLIEVSSFKALKTSVPVFPVFESGAVTQFPYRMTRTYRTVIERQEDDLEKRFEDYAIASGIQRWTVGGEHLSNEDATLLLNSWEGNFGPYRSMSFTEPETTVVFPSVHFVETELVHELAEPCVNSIRLTLEELK
jgi:hypothetical protein